MADLTKVSHAGDAYLRALDAAIAITVTELKHMQLARDAAYVQLNPPQAPARPAPANGRSILGQAMDNADRGEGA